MDASSDVPDVLIVGGGTSGGVAAKRLAGSGASVVVLEQGDWPNESEMPGTKPEYELLAGGAWSPNPNDRGRPADYPVNDSASDLPVIMYNGVGGTSICSPPAGRGLFRLISGSKASTASLTTGRSPTKSFSLSTSKTTSISGSRDLAEIRRTRQARLLRCQRIRS